MGSMRLTHWWQYGFLGGVVLSLATLIKLIRSFLIPIVRGGAQQVSWTEAVKFAVSIFAMGFLCGLVVWSGRGVSRRLGLFGDALVGMVVMLVFFTACMFLFDPELLGPKLASGGLPMLAFGAVLGLISGAWFGRDLRKEWGQQKNDPWREHPEEDDNSAAP
jgi:hypothetical protein